MEVEWVGYKRAPRQRSRACLRGDFRLQRHSVQSLGYFRFRGDEAKIPGQPTDRWTGPPRVSWLLKLLAWTTRPSGGPSHDACSRQLQKVRHPLCPMERAVG